MIDRKIVGTTDKSVSFASHGYPALIHRLTYRRRYDGNLHVHIYREESAALKRPLPDKLIEHLLYISILGEDMSDIRGRAWRPSELAKSLN